MPNPANAFAFRRTKPFSPAELKFRLSLSDYLTDSLLPRLRSRTAGERAANQYSGLNVRLADGMIYLQAILTNNSEWGGLAFDFARLCPANRQSYNLSVRRREDWTAAEWNPITAIAAYFATKTACPRAVDWVLLARQKTFEECVDLLVADTKIIGLDAEWTNAQSGCPFELLLTDFDAGLAARADATIVEQLPLPNPEPCHESEN